MPPPHPYSPWQKPRDSAGRWQYLDEPQGVAKGTEVECETLELTDENKLLNVQVPSISIQRQQELSRPKGLFPTILSEGEPGRSRSPRGNREFNQLSGFYSSRDPLMGAQQALGGGAATLDVPQHSPEQQGKGGEAEQA